MTNHEIEILLWVCGSIVATLFVSWLIAREQIKEAYKAGLLLANKDLASAWDRGYSAAISDSKYREKQAPKPTKTPAKQTKNQPSKSKTANSSRKTVSTLKKPAAKKPVVPIISPERRK